MSYILDALKKAEQERGLGRVPRLESVQDNAPQRTRGLVWIIAGALLANAAILAWWLRPVSQPADALDSQALAPIQPPVTPQMQPDAIAKPAPVNEPEPATTAESATATHTILIPSEPEASMRVPAAEITKPPLAVAEPTIPLTPLLRELPAEVRDAVPPLSLDVHVYAPTASSRFVLFNMKKFHEGDQLALGLRIEAITKDGVLMNYQGQQFRILRP